MTARYNEQSENLDCCWFIGILSTLLSALFVIIRLGEFGNLWFWSFRSWAVPNVIFGCMKLLFAQLNSEIFCAIRVTACAISYFRDWMSLLWTRLRYISTWKFKLDWWTVRWVHLHLCLFLLFPFPLCALFHSLFCPHFLPCLVLNHLSSDYSCYCTSHPCLVHFSSFFVVSPWLKAVRHRRWRFAEMAWGSSASTSTMKALWPRYLSAHNSNVLLNIYSKAK